MVELTSEALRLFGAWRCEAERFDLFVQCGAQRVSLGLDLLEADCLGVELKLFLAGTFLIASAAGFCFDLLQLDFLHVGRVLFWPILAGASATALLAAIIKKVRLVPVLCVLVLGLGWLGYRAAHGSTPFPVQEALNRRVVFDAIGILFGIGFGYRLLTLFAGTEGLVHIRMQTELSLAHSIQATLVPTVSFHNASFEVYGKSIPSAEMGGDLMSSRVMRVCSLMWQMYRDTACLPAS